jgi:hypothetical protein
MADEEITQVKIGILQVGIVGLKEVMTELASSMANDSDEDIARVLIQRLSKKNYIPEKAKPEYGQALVRGFRKYLGQEVSTGEESQGLVIKVTDIKEIARYGVLQSPSLVVNGKIVARGRVPAKAQLIEWFKKASG